MTEKQIDLVLVRCMSEEDGNEAQPMGLISMALYLQKFGKTVKILDRFDPKYLDNKRFFETIDLLKPRYIGISAMTTQLEDAFMLGKELRERTDATLLYGGIHFTAVPEDGLRYGDAVVRGEGEITTLKILNGEIKPTGIINGEELKNLDDIPLPDDDFIRENIRETRQFTMMTSRGCPYRCVFCLGADQRPLKIRYHSIPYVIDYMERVQKVLKTKWFFFCDDVFVMKEKRTYEFCDAYDKRGLKGKIRCFIHPNVGSYELFKRMKKSDFREILIGIESGNEEIQKLIGKKVKLETAREKVKLIRKAGMRPGPLYMIGNIGETKETIIDTIKFAYDLNEKGWFSLAQPFPGSEFYNDVEKYGTLVKKDYVDYNNLEVSFIPNGMTAEELVKLRDFARKVVVRRNFFKRIFSPKPSFDNIC